MHSTPVTVNWNEGVCVSGSLVCVKKDSPPGLECIKGGEGFLLTIHIVFCDCLQIMTPLLTLRWYILKSLRVYLYIIQSLVTTQLRCVHLEIEAWMVHTFNMLFLYST